MEVAFWYGLIGNFWTVKKCLRRDLAWASQKLVQKKSAPWIAKVALIIEEVILVHAANGEIHHSTFRFDWLVVRRGMPREVQADLCIWTGLTEDDRLYYIVKCLGCVKQGIKSVYTHPGNVLVNLLMKLILCIVPVTAIDAWMQQHVHIDKFRTKFYTFLGFDWVPLKIAPQRFYLTLFLRWAWTITVNMKVANVCRNWPGSLIKPLEWKGPNISQMWLTIF